MTQQEGFINFEDGEYIEFMTPVGWLTAIYDERAHPPFRLYGPDGIQLDPRCVINAECEHMTQGFAAYDLSSFVKEER